MGDKMAIPRNIRFLQDVIEGLLIMTRQCTKGVYPFHDGNIEDFEPVFDYLIKVRACSVSDDPSVNAALRPSTIERYQRRLQRCLH